MNVKEKAQKLFNWVADTQFNIVYNSDGKLIPRRQLTEQIRYRANTYVEFCFGITDEFPNRIELSEVKDELDKCFYNSL